MVHPGQVEVVEGEGMPVRVSEQEEERAGEEEYGRLIVEYMVVLPDRAEKGHGEGVLGAVGEVAEEDWGGGKGGQWEACWGWEGGEE